MISGNASNDTKNGESKNSIPILPAIYKRKQYRGFVVFVWSATISQIFCLAFIACTPKLWFMTSYWQAEF